LLKAFADEQDVHRATAAEVFGQALEAVTADQRRSAKAINFGLMYGMSAFGLAKQLGISRGEAQQYVDLYFERYPGVKKFMDEVRNRARDQGFVETVFRRRLYLPDINDRNMQRRQYAERSAINAPMQGTAADIIKKAMISVHDWLQKDQPPARMISGARRAGVRSRSRRCSFSQQDSGRPHEPCRDFARAAARGHRNRSQLGRSALVLFIIQYLINFRN
jgi:DNA polymerase-1